MQRLVFLKGFSKNVSPYPCQSFTPPRPFSHFNTSSSTRPHSWPWTAPKAKFSQALYSSPIPKIQISRNAILKTAPNYGLAQTKMGFLRFRFSERGFSSFSNPYTRRSWFQSLTPNGVVLGLILSNVAVFLLWRVADTSFMLRNFSISVDNFTSGRVHTLVTSAFSHADQWHLISNMIGLYFFGTSVGQTFGSGYLVKLYLSGAVLGSVFYLVYHAFIAPSLQAHRSGMTRTFSSSVPGLGASGAVNAIMLLDIFLFPKKTLYLEFIIPVPAILLGIFLIGKDVLRILEGDQLISGSAHLGGALAAAIAWARIRRGSLRF